MPICEKNSKYFTESNLRNVPYHFALLSVQRFKSLTTSWGITIKDIFTWFNLLIVCFDYNDQVSLIKLSEFCRSIAFYELNSIKLCSTTVTYYETYFFILKLLFSLVGWGIQNIVHAMVDTR